MTRCTNMKKDEDDFKSGDRALYKKVKYDVERAIRAVTVYYRRKLYGQFLPNNACAFWQGLLCITGYKQKLSTHGTDSTTPDNLNNFYARFDCQNSMPIIYIYIYIYIYIGQPARPCCATPTFLHCARTHLAVPLYFKVLSNYRTVSGDEALKQVVLMYLKAVTNSCIWIYSSSPTNRCTDDAVALATAIGALPPHHQPNAQRSCSISDVSSFCVVSTLRFYHILFTQFGSVAYSRSLRVAWGAV